MAVAAVGTPTSYDTTFGVDEDPTTFANTVPSGAATTLLMGVLIDSATTTVSDTGVTYNSLTATPVAAAVLLNSTQWLRFYYIEIASPDGNSHDVVIDPTAACQLTGFAQAFTGAGTPTGQVSASTAADDHLDVGPITSAVGDMIVSMIVCSSPAESPVKDASDTSIFTLGATPGNLGSAAAYRAGAATVTPTWTISFASLSALGINIPAAAEPPAPTVHSSFIINRIRPNAFAPGLAR